MDDNSELDIMLDELLNYFIHVERQTLLLVERGIKDKSELMLAADAYLRTRGVSAESRKRLIDHFSRFIWGYYILEEAINDKDISDIKVLSENNVRIKRKGRRMNADIRFPSKSDYKRFLLW